MNKFINFCARKVTSSDLCSWPTKTARSPTKTARSPTKLTRSRLKLQCPNSKLEPFLRPFSNLQDQFYNLFFGHICKTRTFFGELQQPVRLDTSILYACQSNGRCATNKYFQIIGSIHDIESYFGIDNTSSLNVQIFFSHWGHLAIIFLWVSRNLFHIGWNGNYELWVKNPIATIPIAHGIWDPHFGLSISDRAATSCYTKYSSGKSDYTIVLSYSGIYNWLYTLGFNSVFHLYNFVMICELLAVISIPLGKVHLIYLEDTLQWSWQSRYNTWLLNLANSTYKKLAWAARLWPLRLAMGPLDKSRLAKTRCASLAAPVVYRILAHKGAIISHLSWICLWLGFHTLGLYIHNDTIVAFGEQEKQILIEPVFGQIIQESYCQSFDSFIMPLGPGDLLAHHAIALGLHVTILILLKGSLDGCGSKLMPDKIHFGYGFACDGPGRGGTCDISAWDSFYLATFWMLNTGAWITFYFHWKHLTLNTVFQFDESSTYLNGWFRDYLWFNSTPLIHGYNTFGANDLSIWAWAFLAAHLCWATGFMFLISWRGYWQELIDIILYMHLKTPILYNLWNGDIYTPVALSIVQARFVGLVHFGTGFILTYTPFIIGATS